MVAEVVVATAAVRRSSDGGDGASGGAVEVGYEETAAEHRVTRCIVFAQSERGTRSHISGRITELAVARQCDMIYATLWRPRINR